MTLDDAIVEVQAVSDWLRRLADQWSDLQVARVGRDMVAMGFGVTISQATARAGGLQLVLATLSSENARLKAVAESPEPVAYGWRSRANGGISVNFADHKAEAIELASDEWEAVAFYAKPLNEEKP